jgi:integrase
MTKRRAKGDGSVYWSKDGRCIGEYNDAKGKRRYVSGKTKAEVRAKLRKALADQEEGIACDCENLTVGLYLDRWLDSVRATVRESTHERYQTLTRLHIAPMLGNVKLDRLNALQVQAFYSAKLDEGLSNDTVRNLHIILLSSLKQAVRWKLIRSNVCASVTPPRRIQHELKPLSTDQVKVLLDTAREDPLYPLYVLAVTTGMRQAELSALAWDCVDLDTGTVHVKRTVWKGKVSAPKTPRSRRSIRLSRMATIALRKHRKRCDSSPWVFPNQVGKPMDRHSFSSRRWKPLLNRAGLPHSTRFHDLRHTCATLLLWQGINPKVISDMLGHSDVGFALSVYAHVLPSMQQHAARQYGRGSRVALRRARSRSERLGGCGSLLYGGAGGHTGALVVA